MQAIVDDIKTLFGTYSDEKVISIYKIPQSGSIRQYFRIVTAGRSFIAAYGINVKENQSFLRFSWHFRKCHCPVPEIYAVNEAETIYIQEDFGDRSLLNELEEKGIPRRFTLFLKKAYGRWHICK